jgi:alpha-1,2-mannosyltransferase
VRHGMNRGFHDYEISLLAAAWFMPLLSRAIAGVTGIPLGLLVLLALYAFIVQRAVRDRLGSVIKVRGIAQA